MTESTEKKKTRRKIDWQHFIFTVLGTAIGVALTFAVNGVIDQRKKEKARRLTAIMVIHDIDESLAILKEMVEPEEESGKLLQYALERRDHLEKMPFDSLTRIAYSMMESSSPFRFDTSKEKVFNSDLDTWQNLENMKFIDNVQSFFYDRLEFEEWYNADELWRKPLSREEYLQSFMGQGWMTQERACEILRAYLKEKLYDKRVIYYIDIASYRLQALKRKIDEWTDLNEENKFIMGISDRELEEYMNSMVVEGDRVTKQYLTGNWTLRLEENSYCDYSFHSDNSFSIEMVQSTSGNWENWSGTFITRSTFSGMWEMKGDSLIMKPGPRTVDEVDVEVDVSGLVPAEGKRDSLDSWLIKTRQLTLEGCREFSETRHAFHSRLDSSHDKMRWIDSDGDVHYLKRK